MAQLVLLALALALPPLGPRWPVGLRALALPLGAAGVLLIGLGAAALGPSLTILPRPKPDGRFIRAGIYNVVRHPIYGGVLLVAFAWSLWRASLAHLMLAVALAVFFAAKARFEETSLIARFPAYAEYRRRVRGFVPWIY